jgi:hypothetical protein
LRANGRSPLSEAWKAFLAFSAVAATSISVGAPRTSASVPSVKSTFWGAFARPRSFCGARNGESVSTKSRSSGTAAAATRRCSFFGYVTLPANEVQ